MSNQIQKLRFPFVKVATIINKSAILCPVSEYILNQLLKQTRFIKSFLRNIADIDHRNLKMSLPPIIDGESYGDRDKNFDVPLLRNRDIMKTKFETMVYIE